MQLTPSAPGKMTYEEFLAWADEDTLAEWVEGCTRLYDLEQIIREAGQEDGAAARSGVGWEDLDSVVDSPLASRLTAVYDQLKGF